MRCAILVLTLALAACSGPRSGAPAAEAAPATRGVVLISIDALRADALGAYGATRPTTPFLDRLARRAVVFENAFCQIPSTLPSHLSMFTGLYPTQHGVLPPSGVLSAAIPTLPELLRAGGVRTFGHSEGGYVQGGYGFARGFEEWTDTPWAADTDVERTFRRGLESLSKVAPGERFFLFLHTYTVHDPFAPPPGYAERFWSGPPPAGAFPASGSELAAFNRGERAAVAGAAGWYRALYDAGVRYLDDVLADFFAELERSGLAQETTVVFTSDHGEEFLEHGRFVHTQLYPECLRVPLVIVHPALRAPRRVRALAQTVDLAPTVLDLSGAEVPAGLAGRSLRPELGATDAGAAAAGRALGQEEATAIRGRTVLRAVDGRLLQLARWSVQPEADGFWMGRELTFDAAAPVLELSAAAFARARRVEARSGGELLAALEIGSAWARYRIPLPPGGKRRVTLTTDGCDRPRDLGQGEDERCLSVKLAGAALDRVELYDLGADPLAARDLSAERPDLVRTLAGELRQYPEAAIAPPTGQTLSEAQIRDLEALGYL
jgi:arylsulfatase A-like enzyme